MFAAVVLDNASVNCLKSMAKLEFGSLLESFLYQTKNGDPLPHHMTLNMGPYTGELELGTKVSLFTNMVIMDQEIGACAANVTKAETDDGAKVISTNKYPHITICIKNGSKPFMSNKLFEASCATVAKIESCHLKGVIQECQ